ncbi:MAG: 4-hydroxy-tetrahydrodipicolinate reductase [Deltaproteobacteria bacterium]|nr:4-hydroxy-tetrahydrodipicolinate reductase [Deltaproteobacteria bacterium]
MARIEVVVTGVKGRMGSTLSRLVQADPDLDLVGGVERQGNSGGLEGLGCPVAEDLAAVLAGPASPVVIDFTSPKASLANAAIVRKMKARAVIGTTGLSPAELRELQELAKDVPLFWAPNMSVGINALLEILPGLVKNLGLEYDLEISEIHHRHKKDAPSGTALKLGECLAQARGTSLEASGEFCRHGIIGERESGRIGVQTLRGGDVVGDHTVYFFGPGERIEITHRAHSRETFAKGALRAAKWLSRQSPGRLYTVRDMFV